jgi:hypothetical protein
LEVCGIGAAAARNCVHPGRGNRQS